ncbi:MAG: ATP-binding cassette domain-containing protein [bacterium]
MEKKASDRRQYPRVTDNLEVSVRHSGEHDALRYASSIDIAGGGFRLASDVPVKPKSYCWLEFTLPNDEEQELIECLAEVRWVRDGGDEAPGKILFGVQFFDIEEADRRRLVRYIFSRHYGVEIEEGVAITARNIFKKYKRAEALRDVSFEINRGEIFALIGPAGSGKTTLARILSTQIKPTSGSVEILGFDALKQRKEIRCLTGHMPQKPEFHGDLTPLELLRALGRAYKINERKLPDVIDEALAFTDLADFAESKIATLDAANLQRLSLASALIHRPKILFLDAPTAGMDLKTRKSFWDYFYHLSDLGVTVFITTQLLEEAELCPRAAYILNGRFVVDGNPEDIRNLSANRVIFTIHGKKHERLAHDVESALPGLIRDLGEDAVNIDSIEIKPGTLEEALKD